MRLIEYAIVFKLLVIRVIHMMDEIIQYIEDVKSDLAEEMSAASIKADVVRQHIDGLNTVLNGHDANLGFIPLLWEVYGEYERVIANLKRASEKLDYYKESQG